MEKLQKVLHLIDAANEWTGRVFSFLIIFMTAAIMWEVVVRYGFNSPTIWVHETSGFLFGAYILLGGGYTLLYQDHVNMDIVYKKWPLRTKAIADLITSFLFFSFSVVLVWKGAEMAWESLKVLEVSSTPFAPPLYPVKLTIPIGAFLLLLQGSAKFARDLITAFTGREAA